VEDLATAHANEKTTHSLRASDVGAPATLGSLSRTVGKEDNGGTPVLASALSGNRSGRAALRSGQREELESNHREN
jgi:hypothetical protein